LGRAQPVKTLDELMVELQTVETLNCMIERTETPPFYRFCALLLQQNPVLELAKYDLS
jgi:hypothetical protein